MKENNHSLVKNTVIYALGDIVPRLFSLITFPILTSYLVPADYGIINYIGTINTFLMIMGILSLNTYYLVHYYKTEGEEAKKRLLGNLDLFIIIFNLGLTLFLYIVGPFILNRIGSEVNFYPYMALGLATSFFNVFKYLPSALFRLQERPLPLTIINICSGVLSLFGSLFAVIYIKADATSVLLSNLIVAIIFAIVFFFITNKNAIWNINVVQLRDALKFSLPLVPGSIAFYLYTTFDRVLMEHELTLSDVGIYSTAATLALLLNIVSYGAYQAFEPYFFKTYGQYSFEDNFKKVRNILLLVCLTGAMTLSCLGEDFFRVFTSEDYHRCYVYVPIISIGAIASAMSRMYSTIVVAKGKTKINAVITIAGAIFSVSFNFVFLQYMGIWASCLSYCFTFALVLFANMFFANINIEHKRPFVALCLFAPCTTVITYIIHIDSLVWSIMLKMVLIILCSIVYCNILRVDLKHLIRQFINNR